MVRADGGVVFFLQEASKAKRWRAIPIGFDYKFLGNHSLNYVHHDTDQMIKMLKKFYADCKVDPTRVKYIEADGSGIKVSWTPNCKATYRWQECKTAYMSVCDVADFLSGFIFSLEK